MKQSWNDDDLRHAVAQATSWRQVSRILGLQGTNPTRLRTRAQVAGVDFSHFKGSRSFSDEELRDAVAESATPFEVQKRLGRGAWHSIQRRIRELGLEFGLPAPDSRRKSLNLVLTPNSTYQSDRTRKRLVEAGLKEERCEGCGLAEWLNGPIPLHLDHINGVHNDNRLENLRILCPNCHSLTPTWGNRKRPLAS